MTKNKGELLALPCRELRPSFTEVLVRIACDEDIEGPQHHVWAYNLAGNSRDVFLPT